MPDFLAPGVFIQETPSAPPRLEGVATGVCAFVGRLGRGPVGVPVAVDSLAEAERRFGLAADDTLTALALRQCFANGGRQALVLRVAGDAAPATWTLHDRAGGPAWQAQADEPGAWGNRLRLAIAHDPARQAPGEFDLMIAELDAASGAVLPLETFHRLSADPGAPRHAPAVLDAASARVRLRPPDGGAAPAPPIASDLAPDLPGRDGEPLDATRLAGDPATGSGLQALRGAARFDLLCVPDTFALDPDSAAQVVGAGLALCAARGAVYLVDAPGACSADDIVDWAAALPGGEARSQAALWFPPLRLADPRVPGGTRRVPPSGTVAGVIARTDLERGVWKAPSGAVATLRGVQALDTAAGMAPETAPDRRAMERMLSAGVNLLRQDPRLGPMAWGARTLQPPQAGGEFRYLPVRRLVLYLQASLAEGLCWAVFELNAPPLWARLRAQVEEFLLRQFQAGAFVGTKPDEAFFVRCDASTTTARHLAEGRLGLVVGVAPLRPAEFVVLRIDLAAGPADPPAPPA